MMDATVPVAGGRSPRAVAAAVVVADGRALLVRRQVPEGELVWTLPTGQIEAGETAEQAAVRETGEETGIEVEATVVLGERVHPLTARRVIYVACRYLGGEPATGAADEIAEVLWAEKAQLADLVAHGFFSAVQDYFDREL